MQINAASSLYIHVLAYLFCDTSLFWGIMASTHSQQEGAIQNSWLFSLVVYLKIIQVIQMCNYVAFICNSIPQLEMT